MFRAIWVALVVVGLVLLFVLIAMPDTQRARERKRMRAEQKRRMTWSQRAVAVLVGMAVTGIVGRLYQQHELNISVWIWLLLIPLVVYGSVAYLYYRRRRDRTAEREQAAG
ncbi:MAG: hypothetical protein ACYTGV_02095 [Planctomycetota bacterium]